MNALSVIQYPSGRYGFVGSVPAVLAVETDDPSLIEVGARCGLDLAKRIGARRGKFIRGRAWDSRQEALAEAARHGFAVTNSGAPRMLSDTMRAADVSAIDFLAARYPRLLRAMKWAAILCDTEAGAALRDYVLARDGIYDRDLLRYGGGEAVCHFGGPVAVIEAAIRSRAVTRRLHGAAQ